MPDTVKRQAASCLVDYLACAFLGERMLHDKTLAILDCLSGDCGISKLIGMGRTTSTQAAALLNGMHAHVAELDDGHRYGMMHAGSPILSALLAMVPNNGITGEQFVLGVVMGYEAAIRLASAVQPGMKLKGVHATGTCGTIGAALAIAYASGYSTSQKQATLSAAATDAAALLEMMDSPSELKPYNVARAAAAGVNAALMGCAGYAGPHDPLGGKRGFLQLMASDVNESRLIDGFGETYCIETVYRKPYAACRHAHAAVEAAMIAAADNGVSADDIQSVHIETYGLAVGGHDHTEVTGVSSAKMSTPYSVAAALVYGRCGYQQFEPECLADQRVIDLMKQVSVAESPELSALVPAKRGAIATIVTASGSCSARVDYPKGEPENPITTQELDDKFYSLLAAAGRDESYSRTLLNTAWQVESDLDNLLMLL